MSSNMNILQNKKEKVLNFLEKFKNVLSIIDNKTTSKNLSTFRKKIFNTKKLFLSIENYIETNLDDNMNVKQMCKILTKIEKKIVKYYKTILKFFSEQGDIIIESEKKFCKILKLLEKKALELSRFVIINLKRKTEEMCDNNEKNYLNLPILSESFFNKVFTSICPVPTINLCVNTSFN